MLIDDIIAFSKRNLGLKNFVFDKENNLSRNIIMFYLLGILFIPIWFIDFSRIFKFFGIIILFILEFYIFSKIIYDSYCELETIWIKDGFKKRWEKYKKDNKLYSIEKEKEEASKSIMGNLIDQFNFLHKINFLRFLSYFDKRHELLKRMEFLIIKEYLEERNLLSSSAQIEKLINLVQEEIKEDEANKKNKAFYVGLISLISSPVWSQFIKKFISNIKELFLISTLVTIFIVIFICIINITRMMINDVLKYLSKKRQVETLLDVLKKIQLDISNN